MRKLLTLLAVLVAGCGSTHHTNTITPVKTVQGHVCSPQDEALQCILPPAKLGLLLPSASNVTRGVDFAWGAPSVGQMRSLGAKFGASYFSYDQSKGWTQRAGLVASYHAAGIATVGVWETSANRALAGFSAGQADAREASRQAAAVGNADRPLTFAIDCDCSGPAVSSYFQGVHSVLGDRGNAYGGYYPLTWLCSHHLVGRWNWATYAWSGGNWPPASCAPLEQYLNDSSVDYDRAIAADYGQWPAPGPPPCNAACRRHADHVRLQADYRTRTVLRSLLTKHRCRTGHASPKSYSQVCKHWLAAGAAVNADLRALHARGIH